MIHITSKAKYKIKEVLSQQSDMLLRMSVVGGGCSGNVYDMGFDTWREDDEQFENIIVDSLSYRYLDGITVDFVETLKGSGFVFENPNAVRSCGCGKSFAV